MTDGDRAVKYITFLSIVNWIIDNNINYIWCMDMMDAYYRVPIATKYIRYMGIKVCDYIIFYTCLVFGLASACSIYTQFAECVVWIISHANPLLFFSNLQCLLLSYLDDFLGGSSTLSDAKLQFIHTLSWIRRLGIPTQDSKTTHPCQKRLYWISLECS